VEDPSCHHKKLTSIRNPFFFLFDERAQRFCNFVNTVHDLNLHLKTQKSKKIGCGMDIKGSKPGSESQNMKKNMRGEFVMDPAPDPSQTEGFAVGSSQ